MKFTVLTLFPELVEVFFDHGMIGRAMERKLISGESINIRDFATDRHRTVDDRPYGGGSGMVMKPEPLGRAIRSAREKSPRAKVILMTPQGKRFNQEDACRMAEENQDLIFVCGRYEGIDERVHSLFVDEEMSIGDYVMTGGELAAMAIIDSTARLIPGVLGSEASPLADSFVDGRLEHAQYTRPERFEGIKVPEVLLSGDHGKVAQWRLKSGLTRTFLNRPDLFEQTRPSKEEKKVLLQWAQELKALAGESV
ncbi:tRNA (guanosine(37)-N1)-methyltransferase TrmD [Desulfospira joergensenii]|uniref:tRNA (guanosine(37)-N1)-methyltransferase TrmD n=1 Tax=Desulfospira joergensenii TaxID=53329 RepID=UPI0003B3106B|nr:tRNA (guanosine(37)-N1)-methyltransferase TrmD [Desulfospira joergensenii]